MEVACEMQVYLFHWQHLSVSASCSAAFHAEAWSKRWFTQSEYSFFAYSVQSQGQSHANCGFSYSSLCRTDCCNQNKMMFFYLLYFDSVSRNFSHVAAILFNILFWDINAFGNCVDVLQLGFLSNFNIRFHNVAICMQRYKKMWN